MARTGYHRNIPALQRSHSINASNSTSIGPDGGTISLPEAGLSFIIPAGCFDSFVSLSISAHSDKVGFDISCSPHTTPKKRIRVEQHIEEHHREPLLLGHISGDGVDELYSMKLEGDRAVAYLRHFSGYLVASGFAGAGTPCDPDVVTDGSCVWVDDGGPEQPK